MFSAISNWWYNSGQEIEVDNKTKIRRNELMKQIRNSKLKLKRSSGQTVVNTQIPSNIPRASSYIRVPSSARTSNNIRVPSNVQAHGSICNTQVPSDTKATGNIQASNSTQTPGNTQTSSSIQTQGNTKSAEKPKSDVKPRKLAKRQLSVDATKPAASIVYW